MTRDFDSYLVVDANGIASSDYRLPGCYLKVFINRIRSLSAEDGRERREKLESAK